MTRSTGGGRLPAASAATDDPDRRHGAPRRASRARPYCRPTRRAVRGRDPPEPPREGLFSSRRRALLVLGGTVLGIAVLAFGVQQLTGEDDDGGTQVQELERAGTSSRDDQPARKRQRGDRPQQGDRGGAQRHDRAGTGRARSATRSSSRASSWAPSRTSSTSSAPSRSCSTHPAPSARRPTWAGGSRSPSARRSTRRARAKPGTRPWWSWPGPTRRSSGPRPSQGATHHCP